MYHPYCIGKSYRELYDIRLDGWRENPEILMDINKIPDRDLEWAHWSQKHFLLSYVNSQTQKAFSENILTIGFLNKY